MGDPREVRRDPETTLRVVETSRPIRTFPAHLSTGVFDPGSSGGQNKRETWSVFKFSSVGSPRSRVGSVGDTVITV